MYSTVQYIGRENPQENNVKAVSIRKLLCRGLKCYARKNFSGKEEININILKKFEKKTRKGVKNKI